MLIEVQALRKEGQAFINTDYIVSLHATRNEKTYQMDVQVQLIDGSIVAMKQNMPTDEANEYVKTIVSFCNTHNQNCILQALTPVDINIKS